MLCKQLTYKKKSIKKKPFLKQQLNMSYMLQKKLFIFS